MNANMESILKGYKDPRLSRYFEPATGQGYSGSTVESGKGQDLIIPAIVSIREARLPRKRTLS